MYVHGRVSCPLICMGTSDSSALNRQYSFSRHTPAKSTGCICEAVQECSIVKLTILRQAASNASAARIHLCSLSAAGVGPNCHWTGASCCSVPSVAAARTSTSHAGRLACFVKGEAYAYLANLQWFCVYAQRLLCKAEICTVHYQAASCCCYAVCMYVRIPSSSLLYVVPGHDDIDAAVGLA
jgi:hypothetical protein